MHKPCFEAEFVYHIAPDWRTAKLLTHGLYAVSFHTTTAYFLSGLNALRSGKNTAYAPLFGGEHRRTNADVQSHSARVSTVLEYIGANVRHLRRSQRLTQEALAEAAELDVRFLQRVERGETNLSVASVVALADALKVSIGMLFRKAKLLEATPGRPAKPGRSAKPRTASPARLPRDSS